MSGLAGIYRPLLAITVLIAMAGCATTGVVPRTQAIPTMPGVYHRVGDGETLWRIAQAYGVDLERLIDVNRLPDATRLTEGQLIFIPGATATRRPVRPPSQQAQDFIWPVRGTLTSFYGATVAGSPSRGIDIQVPSGTIVKAARRGRVAFVDPQFKGYGQTVIVDHGDGYFTVYAGLERISVNEGVTVEQGQAVGQLGVSGRTRHPQLHFEIRKQHVAQNPFHYLP